MDIHTGDSLELNYPNEYFNMIYFDPPFNSNRTYRMSATSEVGFDDNWKDEDYKDFIDKNIKKLKKLLKNDGTLFFHISSSCMFIPETVLRENFKFVEPIFWKKCRPKNNVKNKLGSVVDIIFKCNKITKPKFNLVYQDKDEKYIKKSFANVDERGNYGLGRIVTERSKIGYKYEITIENKTFNPASGWTIKKEELERLISENRIHIPSKSNANLYKKIYISESTGKPCTDLWDDIHSIGNGNEERRYPTEKPIKLLERLILISTNENDIVLDPMCGSGTTGEACRKLNRKCVLNDANKDAINVVKKRLAI